MFTKLILLIKSKRTRQAIIFIGIGFLLIFISIAFHSFHIIYTTSRNVLFLNELTVNIFSHVGIGFLAVGFISVMLDMDHWILYFEERLKKIVFERKYLQNLDTKSLINLQVDVLKAYFKNDSIGGSDGFFKHYEKNILAIIGSPFRVNVSMNLHVVCSQNNPQLIHVNETMSYTCKMNNNNIQKYVVYIPEDGEHEECIKYEVILQHNDLKGKDGCDEKGRIVFDFEQLKQTEHFKKTQKGFDLKIDDYNINNLTVIVMAEYLIKKNRFFAWRMSQPTRNITLNLSYPSNWELAREFFIRDNEIVNEFFGEENGTYTLNINGWLMPDEGMTYQFAEKK